MRILLLEDDANLQLAYLNALEDDGHLVYPCASEEQAFTLLEQENRDFDLLLLDLCIGSETSLSFASYASFASPKAKVIFITGSGMYPNGELNGLTGNVAWTLRKPISMHDLKTLVEFEAERA